MLQPGQILPRLSLEGPSGTRSVAGPGNQSSLLVFLHPQPCQPCTGYLSELADTAGDLAQWATNLVVVGAESEVGAIPVLQDKGGGGRRQLGIGQDEAAVILVDRWGEAFEVAAFGADHGFPLPSQLVESAKILDLSCGECNVPSPEWRKEPD